MGPKPATSEYNKVLPALPADLSSVEEYIKTKEAQHKIKPDNEARIIWANDSAKQKTEYAIVYMHGFSASQAEGEPVHRNIAKKFGCNLFLTRLAEHGIDTTEPLAKLTVEKYWNSAKESFAIAKQLGNKVILMGTSTGGSLALKLAAEFTEVHSLILLSPNIAINEDKAWILNNPWGLQIAKLVKGSAYNDSKDQRDIYKQYWNHHYRLEGAVALEEFLETAMRKATFEKIKQPTLVLYYYKDDVHQDSVVKVSAMKEMFEELGTPKSLKKIVSMPNTGNHVMASYIKSKDIKGVENEIEKFMQEVLKLQSE